MRLRPISLPGQRNNYDSLHQALAQEVSDSIAYRICRKLKDHFDASNRDSALFYADKCLTLASRNGFKLEMAESFSSKAFYLMLLYYVGNKKYIQYMM
jgi:hypothetical protein